jgi:hypothetical protein
MPTQTDAQRTAALAAAGVNPASLPVQPTTPAPIAISTLTTPQAPLNVKAPGVAPVPIVPIAPITAPAGWDAQTYANFKAANPTLEPTAQDTAKMQAAGNQPSSFTTSLEQLQSQLAGKTLDTAATKNAATAPYEQQLNQLNTQIAQQQAKALQNQEAALRSGETTGFASREAQNIQRTDAIEMLKLQAMQAGLQGNIALAEKHAQTAIDTKYGQIEKDLEAAKSNIYANFENFTAAEKKRAEATLLRLDKDDALVKQQKEDDKTIYAMAVAATKNFPNDPEAQYNISKAMESGDLMTAFSLIGQYQADPVALQNAILEQNIKREQLREMPLAFATQEAVAAANIDQSKAAAAASRAAAAKSLAETGGGTSTGSGAFVAQPAYAKLTAKQKTQADSLNNLVRSITEYKQYVKDNVGASGVKLTGQTAAVLQTKLNSIIFAAAQAEGTGALQAADRQVIEKIIPNPTSPAGAFSALTKGGKEGQLLQLDDQIKKYQDNLAGYGLTPTVPATSTANPAKGQSTTINGHTYISDGTQWVLQK